MEGIKTVDVFLLLGIGQGLFLAIVLCFLKQPNFKANRVLSLILVFSSIMLVGRLFYMKYAFNPVLFRFATSVDTIVFLIGPLVYTYYRNLIFNHKTFYIPKSWYFFPAVIHFGFVVWTFSMDTPTYLNLMNEGGLNTAYLLTELVGITANFFFLIKCRRLLERFRSNVSKNHSFKQGVVGFLTTVLWVYFIILLVWTVSFLGYYVFSTYFLYVNYDYVWITIPLLIYVIGFYSLKQPEIFRVPLTSSNEQLAYQRIDQKEIDRLQTSLETLLVEEKVYYDHQLTLKELAEKCDTTSNNLSWMLNNVYHTNFYEYINKYRIDAFLEKVQKGEHKSHTISAISADVGFNSKSTFYKVFKSQLGTTPSSYIQERSPA